MKIAIASSGLGHVRRGVESWADDLALALHRAGSDVALFQGFGAPGRRWCHTLPCWRRADRRTLRLRSLTRRLGGWRYGCGSEYDIEQTTFALSLWGAIHRGYDILHVQDPHVARVLDWLWRRGWSRPRVILAHGTEEPADQLRKYTFLQHLAPCYHQDWEPLRPPGQLSFAIPNFVNTEMFHPGGRAAARIEWRLPQDALIVLSVAALKNSHKRCDYVIREFASFLESYPAPAVLVLAGAAEKETPAVLELGKRLLGDALRVYQSLDRARLPSLYRAADIFCLGSLSEMMPIATLEALASGLPVTCNRTPVLEWMAGEGGAPCDISQPGGLVKQWQALTAPEARQRTSAAARKHAEEVFSEPVVLRQVLDMYRAVMSDRAKG
jgi:1,2-diacylglycerol 3-alpha-glucosyltransferase